MAIDNDPKEWIDECECNAETRKDEMRSFTGVGAERTIVPDEETWRMSDWVGWIQAGMCVCLMDEIQTKRHKMHRGEELGLGRVVVDSRNVLE